MLNPIPFRVTMESGPLAATANGLDYVAYEDTFGRAFITDLANGYYKAQMFVAWHALLRTGQIVGTFEDFLALSPRVSSQGSDDADPELDAVPPLEGTTTPTS
jgi:hypothetical protein